MSAITCVFGINASNSTRVYVDPKAAFTIWSSLECNNFCSTKAQASFNSTHSSEMQISNDDTACYCFSLPQGLIDDLNTSTGCRACRNSKTSNGTLGTCGAVNATDANAIYAMALLPLNSASESGSKTPPGIPPRAAPTAATATPTAALADARPPDSGALTLGVAIGAAVVGVAVVGGAAALVRRHRRRPAPGARVNSSVSPPPPPAEVGVRHTKKPAGPRWEKVKPPAPLRLSEVGGGAVFSAEKLENTQSLVQLHSELVTLERNQVK
ncbi:hypothetical protein BDR26DRAFT_325217 [Obelidium mucronatum]|nr:hypothetical protein BDR26DRAFT_325217 [Obelidium mucronatum]